MDGTLLDDEDAVHDDFWPLIEELDRRDVVFCPASGRQYYNLRERFEPSRTRSSSSPRTAPTWCARPGAQLGLPRPPGPARWSRRAGPDRRWRRRGGGAVRKVSAYIERRDGPSSPRSTSTTTACSSSRTSCDRGRHPQGGRLRLRVLGAGVRPGVRALPRRYQVGGVRQHWLDLMGLAANKGTGIRHIQEALGITATRRWCSATSSTTWR